MAPRLIELCFQTAGLWEMGDAGPHGFAAAGRVGSASYGAADQAEGPRLYAMVTPDPKQGTFDAEVVDAAGNRYSASKRLSHGGAARCSGRRAAESCSHMLCVGRVSGRS